jgi:D-arginine dehydrogenase
MYTDVLVIGGGIAGLSAAAWLAPHSSVTVVEAEPFLGFHTTGRSAALYTECYGDGVIRRLTLASRDFLMSHEGLTESRPVLFVGEPGDSRSLDALEAEFSALVPSLERVSPRQVADLCGAFAPDATSGGVLEPLAMEIDVDALQSLYTRTVRAHGGSIVTDARVGSLRDGVDTWTVQAGGLTIDARTIVNAAGAWGDEIAIMAGLSPIGLTPLLRSVFTASVAMSTAGWPFVIDANERWYFKPEGPNILGSAASEIPVDPCDARAPELDIALGIERVNGLTSLGVRSVMNTWAGLRTFTPDRSPCVGFDPDNPRFLWLVGQGGYGIMTSPALGEVAASLVLNGALPQHIEEFGVSSESLSPVRFRM